MYTKKISELIFYEQVSRSEKQKRFPIREKNKGCVWIKQQKKSTMRTLKFFFPHPFP